MPSSRQRHQYQSRAAPRVPTAGQGVAGFPALSGDVNPLRAAANSPDIVRSPPAAAQHVYLDRRSHARRPAATSRAAIAAPKKIFASGDIFHGNRLAGPINRPATPWHTPHTAASAPIPSQPSQFRVSPFFPIAGQSKNPPPVSVLLPFSPSHKHPHVVLHLPDTSAGQCRCRAHARTERRRSPPPPRRRRSPVTPRGLGRVAERVFLTRAQLPRPSAELLVAPPEPSPSRLGRRHCRRVARRLWSAPHVREHTAALPTPSRTCWFL
jgi:hypothetical protein